METFVNRTIQITTLIAVVSAFALIMSQQLIWAEGFLVAVLWSILNFWLSSEVLKIAIFKENKQKLFLMLLVKFPLLYLLGFFVLISRLFEVSSLLTGLPLVWVVMGVIKLCPKFMPSAQNCQI
jgi:CDP-diglyceride synthetase